MSFPQQAFVVAMLLVACANGTESSGQPPSEQFDGGGNDGSVACAENLASNSLNCGACGHDCLGAACTAGVCQPTVIGDVQGFLPPHGLAIGSSDVFFYGPYDSLLGRFSKYGGPMQTYGNTGARPTGVGVHGESLYWSVDLWVGHTVGTRPIVGGDSEFGGKGTFGSTIAVDADGVFISELTTIAGAVKEGVIGRYSHDLQQHEFLFAEDYAVLLVSTKTQLVWISEYYPSYVIAGSKTIAPGEPVLTHARQKLAVPAQGNIVGLAANLTDAYVTDGSTLWRVPLSGSQPTALLSNAQASSVAVDDSGVYVTTSNSVLRIDLEQSSKVQSIAKGQDAPRAVTTDEQFVYWINAETRVTKVAK